MTRLLNDVERNTLFNRSLGSFVFLVLRHAWVWQVLTPKISLILACLGIWTHSLYVKPWKLAKQLGPATDLVDGKIYWHARDSDTRREGSPPNLARARVHFALSFGDNSQSTKMAARGTRYYFPVEKSNFLRLRNTLKCFGVLCRSRHSECLVELEVGGQWVYLNEFMIDLKKSFCYTCRT